jgi:hypothetical protein
MDVNVEEGGREGGREYRKTGAEARCWRERGCRTPPGAPPVAARLPLVVVDGGDGPPPAVAAPKPAKEEVEAEAAVEAEEDEATCGRPAAPPGCS